MVSSANTCNLRKQNGNPRLVKTHSITTGTVTRGISELISDVWELTVIEVKCETNIQREMYRRLRDFAAIWKNEFRNFAGTQAWEKWEKKRREKMEMKVNKWIIIRIKIKIRRWWGEKNSDANARLTRTVTRFNSQMTEHVYMENFGKTIFFIYQNWIFIKNIIPLKHPIQPTKLIRH